MSETTQEEINGYDAEIARLKRELKDAQNRRSEALCRPWGIQIGQVVRGASRRSEGKVGQIVSYEAPSRLGDRPWVTARLRNKDGSFGGREHNFFDGWERVEDAASDAA